MNDEEGRRITTIEAFNVAEKRVKERNAKLTEAGLKGRRKVLRLLWKRRKGRLRLSSSNFARPRMSLLQPRSK